MAWQYSPPHVLPTTLTPCKQAWPEYTITTHSSSISSKLIGVAASSVHQSQRKKSHRLLGHRGNQTPVPRENQHRHQHPVVAHAHKLVVQEHPVRRVKVNVVEVHHVVQGYAEEVGGALFRHGNVHGPGQGAEVERVRGKGQVHEPCLQLVAREVQVVVDFEEKPKLLGPGVHAFLVRRELVRFGRNGMQHVAVGVDNLRERVDLVDVLVEGEVGLSQKLKRHFGARMSLFVFFERRKLDLALGDRVVLHERDHGNETQLVRVQLVALDQAIAEVASFRSGGDFISHGRLLLARLEKVRVQRVRVELAFPHCFERRSKRLGNKLAAVGAPAVFLERLQRILANEVCVGLADQRELLLQDGDLGIQIHFQQTHVCRVGWFFRAHRWYL